MTSITHDPAKIISRINLDDDERFHFQPRYASKNRTYLAARVLVQWEHQGNEWVAVEIQWAGPLITKSGLSDAISGDDRRFMRFDRGEIPAEALAVAEEAKRTLPVIETGSDE